MSKKKLTRERLRQIIREEKAKLEKEGGRLDESITQRELRSMVADAEQKVQKARIQGTNDIRNFIDPDTTPDPEMIENMSDSEREDVVQTVVQADENLVEAMNALYELKNRLA